jgi:hypothetical protein
MISLKNTAIPKQLTPAALLMIIIADQIHTELGLQFVITSLNDSKHGDNSYHYSGNAFDSRVRSSNWPSAKLPDRETCDKIVQIAAARLGPCYDVIYEIDHIHWEYNARQYG